MSKLTPFLVLVSSFAHAQVGGVVAIEQVASTRTYTQLFNAQINSRGDVAFFGTSGMETGIWVGLREDTGYVFGLAIGTTDSIREEMLRTAHYVLDDRGAITAMVRTSSDPVLEHELWHYEGPGFESRKILGHGDPCPDGTPDETAVLAEDFRVRSDGRSVLFHAGACGSYRWTQLGRAMRIDGGRIGVTNHPLGLAVTTDSINPTWALNTADQVLFAGNARCEPPCVFPPGLLSTGAGVYRLGSAAALDGVGFYGDDEPLMGGMAGPPVESLGAIGPLSMDDMGVGATLAFTSLSGRDRALIELGVDAVLIARPGGPTAIAGSTYTRVGLNAEGNEERFWVTDQAGPTKVLFEAETINPPLSGFFDQSGVVALFPEMIQAPDAGLIIGPPRQVRVGRDRTIVLEGDLSGPDVQFQNQNAIVAFVPPEGYRLIARAGTTYTLGGTEIEWPEFATFELGEQPFATSVPGLQIPRTSSGMDGRGRAFVNDRLVFIERSLGVFIARPKDAQPYDWSIRFEAPDTVVVSLAGTAPDDIRMTLEPMPVPSFSDGSIGGPPLQVDRECEMFDSLTTCVIGREPETRIQITLPTDGEFRNVRAVLSPLDGHRLEDANLENNEAWFAFNAPDADVDGGVGGTDAGSGGGGGGSGCAVFSHGSPTAFFAILFLWTRFRV